MNTAAINRAIAETLGMKAVHDRDQNLWSIVPHGKYFNGGISEEHAWHVCCPRFTDSLDVCRLFENALTMPDGRLSYLFELVVNVIKIRRAPWIAEFDGPLDVWILFNATPPQRCEAYLRMKGLWKEEV